MRANLRQIGTTASRPGAGAFARFAWVAALVSALGLGGCSTPGGSGGATPPASPPTVSTLVLVTVDGVPASRLAPFGGDLAAPGLSRLVGLGGKAGSGWTASPMARPAVASMFTGLGVDHHGVPDDLGPPLDEGTPVLAEVLREAGYRTAAFPTSAAVGPASGLLRGFQVYDEPEPVMPTPAERVARLKRAELSTAPALSWVEQLHPEAPVFLWIHYPAAGGPEPALLPGGLARRDEILVDQDAALVRVLDALEGKGRLRDAEIIWIATYGEVWPESGAPVGPGFSSQPEAIGVPYVHKAGAGRTSHADRAGVWSPDVAATLAAAAGRDMPGGEGIDLGASGPHGADRILLSWSVAPRHQMGWQGWTSGIRGGLQVVVGFDEGVRELGAGPAHDPASADVASLREAVAARSAVPVPELPREETIALLEGVGLKPRRSSSERTCPPGAPCRDAVRHVWEGRRLHSRNELKTASRSYRTALEADESNLAALVEWGWNASIRTERGQELMRRAAVTHPTAPLAVHWLAHVLIFEGDLAGAERLLTAVLAVTPWDTDPLYDMACLKSIAGDVESSADYLRRSIRGGFRHWDTIHTDPDLRQLRASPLFQSVMREFGK